MQVDSEYDPRASLQLILKTLHISLADNEEIRQPTLPPTCILCQGIAASPIMTSCSMQFICCKCINTNANTCPICRQTGCLCTTLGTMEPLVKPFTLNCPYHAHGCDATFSLLDLINHLETCEYSMFRCGCKAKLHRDQIDHHYRVECPLRTVVCSHCKLHFHQQDIQQHIDNTHPQCPSCFTHHTPGCLRHLPQPCTVRGCGQHVAPCSIKEHLEVEHPDLRREVGQSFSKAKNRDIRLRAAAHSRLQRKHTPAPPPPVRRKGDTAAGHPGCPLPAVFSPASDCPLLVRSLGMIMGTDKAVCIEGITRTRSLLALASPPYELVLSHPGVIDRLISLLDEREDAKFLLEVCWCLTNLTSGNDTPSEALIQAGVVEKFASILHCQDMPHNVIDQVVWCLGNIAIDGPEHRDALIDTGFVPLLASLPARSPLPITLQRNLAWTISAFCRGQPIPSRVDIRPFMQPLAELITSEDIETLKDVCWAFSSISEYGTEEASQILPLSRTLLRLTKHPHFTVSSVSLHVVGNIIASEADITPLLEAGLMKLLKQHLGSMRPNFCQEACWVLSNLSAGAPEHRQLIVQSSILPCLIPILRSTEIDVLKEAVWVVDNCLCADEADITAAFLAHGVVDALIVSLSNAGHVVDARGKQHHTAMALSSLKYLLEYGNMEVFEQGADTAMTVSPVLQQVIEAGGISVLSALQYSPNARVRSEVMNILEYFNES